jgi:hypothetical protein
VSASGAPGRAEIEEALAGVYARPEFIERGPPAWQTALARIFEPVVDFFDRFFERVAPGPAEAGYLVWLIGGILGLIAIVVIAGWIRWALTGRGRDPFARRPRRRSSAPEPGRPTAVEEWEARARGLAAAGRLREAALALYQALLLRLEASGSVRVDPAKTPGDYRREARGHEAGFRVLDEFLRGFEPIAFGNRPVDAVAYERLTRLAAGGAAG